MSYSHGVASDKGLNLLAYPKSRTEFVIQQDSSIKSQNHTPLHVSLTLVVQAGKLGKLHLTTARTIRRGERLIFRGVSTHSRVIASYHWLLTGVWIFRILALLDATSELLAKPPPLPHRQNQFCVSSCRQYSSKQQLFCCLASALLTAMTRQEHRRMFTEHARWSSSR